MGVRDEDKVSQFDQERMGADDIGLRPLSVRSDICHGKRRRLLRERENGVNRRVCGRKRTVRVLVCLVLTAALIVSGALAPLNSRGWYTIRRADAFALTASSAAVALLLGVAGVAAVGTATGAIDADALYDGASTALQEACTIAVQTAGEESSWINPTASGSGYTIDTSKVPDAVLSEVIKYANEIQALDWQAGNVPSTMVLTSLVGECSDFSPVVYRFSESSVNYLAGFVGDFPYLLLAHVRDRKSSGTKRLLAAATPIAVTINGSAAEFRAEGDGIIYNFNWSETTSDVNGLETHDVTSVSQSGGGYSITADTYSAYTPVHCQYAATSVTIPETVVDTPSAISSGMDAVNSADYGSAEQTAAIEALIAEVRALNPQVNVPDAESMPTTINNYNEYVTVQSGAGEGTGTGTGEGTSTGDAIDMGALANAIAAAVGAGATIADIIAALNNLDINLDFADVLEQLLNIYNRMESDADREQRQQELDADLDQIIQLLQSINENVEAILQDMANLDRSTNDIVDLQPVIDAINSLDLPSDPVASDLSVINHQLGDLTESDGEVLTVRGLLHWIHYYISDIDRVLNDWPDYPLPTEISLSAIEGYLSDTLNEIRNYINSFVSYMGNIIAKLDDAIAAIESLDFARRWPSGGTPERPTQTQLVQYVDWVEWDNAVETLMHKFPFVIINDIALIFAALTRPAVTPVFDLPMPNPSDWSSPYMVHVDLSDFDTMAAVMRVGIMLWVISRVSRRTLALFTRDEGAAV